MGITIKSPSASGPYNVSKNLQVVDDFFGAVNPSTQIVSGTGATTAATNSYQAPEHPGVFRLGTGSLSSGHAGRYIATQAPASQGNFKAIAIFSLPSLSSATEGYIVRSGLSGDATAADVLVPTHGVYFKYDSRVSANWLVAWSNGGVEAVTATSTVVTAGTANWFNLEVRLNSARTRAEYYINGSLAYTSETTSGALVDAGDVIYSAHTVTKDTGTTNFFDHLDLLAIEIGVSR